MEVITPEMTLAPAPLIPKTAFEAMRYGNVATLSKNDNNSPGNDAKEATPSRALDWIDRAMDENALSTIAASCSVALDLPKAEIDKTTSPAPRTTRTVKMQHRGELKMWWFTISYSRKRTIKKYLHADTPGPTAYVTVFRNASPDVCCTISSPTTSVANSIE